MKELYHIYLSPTGILYSFRDKINAEEYIDELLKSFPSTAIKVIIGERTPFASQTRIVIQDIN